MRASIGDRVWPRIRKASALPFALLAVPLYSIALLHLSQAAWDPLPAVLVGLVVSVPLAGLGALLLTALTALCIRLRPRK
jgi:hypothetical protein